MLKVKFSFSCFVDWNNSLQAFQSMEGTLLVMEGNTTYKEKNV